jgi:hypothetical protein
VERVNKKRKPMYGLLALIQFSILLFVGCGDAGVNNGNIRGSVYSNRSGGALTKTPEPGVTVVASSENDPPIIRTTVSDANGQYVFSGLPVGKYAIGMDKDGFNPLTTEEGASTQQSAIGKGQVWVYVESGGTVQAPDVTLTEKPAEGDGTVIINLIDKLTGERIDGATITVGTSSTSNSSNGQYALTVAVIASTDGSSAPVQQNYSANAVGYNASGGHLQAFAGQTVEYTFEMEPKMGVLEGRIEFAKFENLYEYASISLTVDDLAGIKHPETDGTFSIPVPVRTTNNNRSYTLRVSGKGIVDQVVNNIVGPVAGAVNVTVPQLQPEVVTVVGSVVNPFTSVTAVVEGTGLEGGITGGGVSCPSGTLGQYSIDGVPTHTKDKLKVTVMTYTFDPANCAGTIDYANSSSDEFTAVNNGNGVFRVGPISGGGGS